MNKFFATLFLLTLICCSDNVSDEVAVLQEDIVYLSSERLILTGRIVALGEVNALDHGFIISTEEGLSNPKTIDLGPQNIPGRFVGGLDDLEVNKRYWAAAYADIGGTRLFSDAISFSTLKPSVTDFSPLIGAAGETVTITGTNFTNDTRVLFGDQEAQVVEILAESIIRVRIPETNQKRLAIITVESQGIAESFSDPFEYVIGRWDLVSQFPPTTNIYRENFWTENDDYALFGLGDLVFAMASNDKIYLYSKKDDLWTTLEFEGQPLIEPFAAWPFFGSGGSSHFYRIDGDRINRLQDLPLSLSKSIAFSFDQSLFVFGGVDNTNSESRKIFEYSIDQNTWTRLEGRQFVANSDYPSFKYNNEGYYLGKDNLLMKFSPLSKTWTTISEYPSSVNVENIAQVVGSKVYIGVSKNRKDFWEFDLETLEWKRKEPFTGDFRSAITSSWENDDALYTIRHNVFTGRQPMEIWKFSPQDFQ